MKGFILWLSRCIIFLTCVVISSIIIHSYEPKQKQLLTMFYKEIGNKTYNGNSRHKFPVDVPFPSYHHSGLPSFWPKGFPVPRSQQLNVAKDNLFVWESIKQDEPVDSVWNETFADMIGGYIDRTCPVNTWQYNSVIRMKEALQHWRDISEIEKIPYFISYGSLLGYARDKNMTPYDADIDIVIPSWAYGALRKYSSDYPIDRTADPDRAFLLLHPEFKTAAPPLRSKHHCNGTATQNNGLCAFTYNLGRLAVAGRQVDIMPGDHVPEHNLFLFAVLGARVVSPDIIFPLRKCTFLDLEVLCPNNPAAFMWDMYGPELKDLLARKLCINGLFRTATEAPDEHTEWFREFEERVGVGNVNLTQNPPVVTTKPYHIWCPKYPDLKIASGVCHDYLEKRRFRRPLY